MEFPRVVFSQSPVTPNAYFGEENVGRIAEAAPRDPSARVIFHCIPGVRIVTSQASHPAGHRLPAGLVEERAEGGPAFLETPEHHDRRLERHDGAAAVGVPKWQKLQPRESWELYRFFGAVAAGASATRTGPGRAFSSAPSTEMAGGFPL